MSMAGLKSGVVGCGLIGQRRARVAHAAGSEVAAVTDPDRQRAAGVAEELGCEVADDWRGIVGRPDVAILVVATPNGVAVEIASAALRAGKHVLVEKPPGRNVGEARELAAAAAASGRVLKVGFNHRYHPALERMRQLLGEGAIGTVINGRARYGHGGRPGYEREWRGNPAMAGGGEMTDQGVHLLDLAHWMLGAPAAAFAATQTAFWPVAPLEDNGFAVLRYTGGQVFSFHSSWTQWQNLFSFELFGTEGALVVEGLGGSYGTEQLHWMRRRPQGGAPEVHSQRFEGPDPSWTSEWEDFCAAVRGGPPCRSGAEDGVAVMAALAALYRSSQSRREEAVSL